MSEDERRAREVAERAIRRLNILEWVVLALAGVLALAAGALTAFLLGEAAGLPFRPTWAVASILLFVIPAAAIRLRDRREEGREPSSDREG
ncbi:MAG: DUF2269 family protein [Gemmatimonadetes bacterium]|nr:DUF2269 family protein [Gemmatimonadota bacterium]